MEFITYSGFSISLQYYFGLDNQIENNLSPVKWNLSDFHKLKKSLLTESLRFYSPFVPLWLFHSILLF